MRSKSLLIIFTKKPRLGQVKTRLARSIGSQAALKVYQELLSRVTTAFSKTTYDVAVYFSPGKQKGKDLGERLFNAFKTELKRFPKVVIIGVDCPFITKRLVRQAFSALDESPLALGPAEDGGYYLIGLTRVRPELFRNIAWGTAKVLRQTLRQAKLLGVKPVLLEQLYDIDTIKDLQRWKNEEQQS